LSIKERNSSGWKVDQRCFFSGSPCVTNSGKPGRCRPFRLASRALSLPLSLRRPSPFRAYHGTKEDIVIAYDRPSFIVLRAFSPMTRAVFLIKGGIMKSPRGFQSNPLTQSVIHMDKEIKIKLLIEASLGLSTIER